jgi:ferredoxin
MKIHLDSSRCQGHNRCRTIAPELFDVDEFGLAVLRISSDIPEALEDKARLAVDNCPEFALRLSDES